MPVFCIKLSDFIVSIARNECFTIRAWAEFDVLVKQCLS